MCTQHGYRSSHLANTQLHAQLLLCCFSSSLPSKQPLAMNWLAATVPAHESTTKEMQGNTYTRLTKSHQVLTADVRIDVRADPRSDPRDLSGFMYRHVYIYIYIYMCIHTYIHTIYDNVYICIYLLYNFTQTVESRIDALADDPDFKALTSSARARKTYIYIYICITIMYIYIYIYTSGSRLRTPQRTTWPPRTWPRSSHTISCISYYYYYHYYYYHYYYYDYPPRTRYTERRVGAPREPSSDFKVLTPQTQLT